MIFPYWPARIDSSTASAEQVLYRPLVPLHLITRRDMAFIWALADTGSDQTLLPASIADVLGIAYNSRATTVIQGFGGRELIIAFATVDVVITGQNEQFQWLADVGVVLFERLEDEVAIFGHLGGLHFFRTTFDGEKRQLELVPNALFPGTVSRIDPTKPASFER